MINVFNTLRSQVMEQIVNKVCVTQGRYSYPLETVRIVKHIPDLLVMEFHALKTLAGIIRF